MNNYQSLEVYRCEQCGGDQITVNCCAPLNVKPEELADSIEWGQDKSDYFCNNCEEIGKCGEYCIVKEPLSYSKGWLQSKVANYLRIGRALCS